MKTFHRVLRSSAFAFGLAGCSQPQAPEPAAVEVPTGSVALVVPVADAPPAPKPQPAVAAQPPKAEPPPFAFPADQGGAAIARVVTPNVARPLPADKFAVAPKPRAIPARVREPDAARPASYALSPLLPPKPPAPKPANPAERVPLDLGARADGVPAKPVLPVAAVVTERARDANIPPAAPVLGRALVERVGLDDPTAELGNAAIVSASVRVPPAASAFVKASVPDPFELGEQVRPKVPATAEPSAVPIVINPQRVK